jgi:hypothetical protein
MFLLTWNLWSLRFASILTLTLPFLYIPLNGYAVILSLSSDTIQPGQQITVSWTREPGDPNEVSLSSTAQKSFIPFMPAGMFSPTTKINMGSQNEGQVAWTVPINVQAG